MKASVLIYLITFLPAFTFGQVKEQDALGYDYCKVVYNSLQLYKVKQDGLYDYNFDIHNDSLYSHGSEKIDKISDYGELPAIKISALDSGFDLQKELKDKVYFVQEPGNRYFIYLKNDSTIVYKNIGKDNIWRITKEEEDRIYKINLGNNKYIYWSVYLGLIFKKDNAIQTHFLDLMYHYKYNQLYVSVIDKSKANMETGYFEYGGFIIKLNNGNAPVKYSDTIKDNNYSVYRNNKKIINSFDLRYYNDKRLIAISADSVTVYNSDFKIDSAFAYRDLTDAAGYYIEFITQNNTKLIPVRDYNSTIKNIGVFGCGNVTYTTLKIDGKRIKQMLDGSWSYGFSDEKYLTIDYHGMFDGLTFINGTKSIRWSVNGGYDDRIILTKSGKQGLYKYTQSNDTIKFKQILPIEFDSIYMINSFVFLGKDNRIELLDYYLKNKKMRFTKVEDKKGAYLRYTKADGKSGWLNYRGQLFDDI